MSEKKKSPNRPRSIKKEEQKPSFSQVKYYNPPAHWQPTRFYHFNPGGQPVVMTDPEGHIINSVRGNNQPGEIWMVLR